MQLMPHPSYDDNTPINENSNDYSDSLKYANEYNCETKPEESATGNSMSSTNSQNDSSDEI